MNQVTAESMVTHLVQCSCNGFSDYPKRSKKVTVEAKEVPFKQITYNEADQVGSPMKWNSILKDLLSRCPQFCRDELVLPKPVHTARWRERNSRKVLAPLGLKQNSQNIIAGSKDMSRKRKADTKIWTPTKRVKVDDSLKPCSVVVKRSPVKVLLLEYKCVNNRSFVKLHDIIKEIPQVKEEVKPIAQNEFMEFLGLDSKEPSKKKPCTEVKSSHPVKLVSHPHIPFSSDYGQRLLARERHYLPQEVALRKIERTEWYLKESTTSLAMKNSQEPEISYDNNKKMKHIHTFNFPKRQYHQNHQSLQQAFNKYLCKPFSVQLETMDLSRFSVKKQEEVIPPTIIINELKEEEQQQCIVLPLPEPNKEVLTTDGAQFSGDMNQQRSQSDITCYTNRPKLISKPRRSLRLNHSKS